MSQTERLYWIDAQIRQRLYPNADSVCRKFEVSRRTAYSDRDALTERLNAPLIFDRERCGWTYRDFTYVLPFLALSAREASSLRRSMLAAREYLGPTDARAIALVSQRLAAHIPGAVESESESVGGSLRSASDISVSIELLDACEEAIARRQRLHILYYSAHRNDINERTVQPYHLHNHQGEWHLIAWCEWRASVRQFYLGRVREWRVLAPEGAYQIAPDFDARQYLSRGFGALHGAPATHIRLRFSAKQAHWIRERIYHPTQKSNELPDGRLEITLDVAGTAEILRWILGYGSEVEVIEPAELRDEVVKSAKRIISLYRPEG